MAREIAGRFQQSAADCQAGAESDDVSIIAEATADLVTGTKDIGKAAAALKRVQGES